MSRCCCARPPADRWPASRRSRPRARPSRTPPRCLTCGPWPSRPAGPACSSTRRGAAGFDALLVAEECGRVLAAVPLLGLLPATAILNAAGDATLEAVAAGELRPVYMPARPPSELETGWTGDG